jgi:hypothetical protein
LCEVELIIQFDLAALFTGTLTLVRGASEERFVGSRSAETVDADRFAMVSV